MAVRQLGMGGGFTDARDTASAIKRVMGVFNIIL
jgi:hypothetical protein